MGKTSYKLVRKMKTTFFNSSHYFCIYEKFIVLQYTGRYMNEIIWAFCQTMLTLFKSLVILFKALVSDRLPPNSFGPLTSLETDSPPVVFLANLMTKDSEYTAHMPYNSHLLHLEDEAFCIADVEEEVADDGGGLAVHHLQARAEPVVTRAVHHLR